jgi:LysM repeat protein
MATRKRQSLFQNIGIGLIVLAMGGLVWWLVFANNDVTTTENANGEAGGFEENAGILPTQESFTEIIAGEPIPAQFIPPLSEPVDLSEVPLLVDSALMPALNPYTYDGPRPNITYDTYIVQAGDTPNIIAAKFGIEASTLLGGNPHLSDEANLLQVNDELIILPVDGVLHTVQRGDTVEHLAEEYGVPVEDILAYAENNLEFPYRLYQDTQLLIPGAVAEVFVWEPPALSTVRGGSGFGVAPLVVGTGTFIWPVTGRRITQYYHSFHRGLDIALAEGNPVYASDTGTVVWAAWNNTGYGNLVVVDHGNGYLTFYAHLSGYNAYPGKVVNQGNIIGYTGNTGRSSGPHIHFEIRLNGFQQDPFWPGYLN